MISFTFASRATSHDMVATAPAALLLPAAAGGARPAAARERARGEKKFAEPNCPPLSLAAALRLLHTHAAGVLVLRE